MFKSLVALCLLFSIQLQANDKITEARDAYDLREYDAAGIKSVEASIKLYDEGIAAETDSRLKLVYMDEQAGAYYFLGQSHDKKKVKKAAHQSAMDVAGGIMTEMGVNPKKAYELSKNDIADLMNQLDTAQEDLLAGAMYAKGISLAQWGNLNGIASSIGRLPEVLGLMERVEMMGRESINEYGPYRTIGRINYKLPKLFGGDIEKSEEYLKRATKASLAEGQKYSINGFNNIYLAETLYKRGKENQAKRLLENFLNADFTSLVEGSEPESREALRIAKDLFDDWNS